MSLTINTNIKNDADGYLADAKNIKGTYVVVADREALDNLPAATKVVGTLAYVQDISGGDSDSHFFIYTGTGSYFGWSDIALENKYAVLNTGEGFALQSYEFDSNINFYNVLEYQTIIVVFYDTSYPFIAFSASGITLPNSGSPVVKLTNLITYENKQYLAVLELRGGTTTDNATLSFQELQAGSGGGSSEIGLKEYTITFSQNATLTYAVGSTPDLNNTFTSSTPLIVSYTFKSDNFIAYFNSLVDYINTQAQQNIVNKITEVSQASNELKTIITFLINYGGIDTESKVFNQIANLLQQFTTGQPNISPLADFTEYKKYVDSMVKGDLATVIYNDGNWDSVSGWCWSNLPLFYGCVLQPESNGNTLWLTPATNVGVTFTSQNLPKISLVDNYDLTISERVIEGNFVGGTTSNEKYYVFKLANGIASLNIMIDEEQFTDLLTGINAQLSTNLQTPQDIIDMYDSVKSDSISQANYLSCVTLFTSLARYNIRSNYPNYFSGDGDTMIKIGIVEFIGIKTVTNEDIFNDYEGTESNKLSFNSTSELTITEKTSPNKL